jgi:hypothetical protein
MLFKMGEDLNGVRDRIVAALGSGYEVKTGEELAASSTEGIEEGLAFFNYILLGFAAIALFVGVFLILNTFSIIVAQRTRELALFRAMGARRRCWSVLVRRCHQAHRLGARPRRGCRRRRVLAAVLVTCSAAGAGCELTVRRRPHHRSP